MQILPKSGGKALARILVVLVGVYVVLCVYLYFKQHEFIFLPDKKVENTPKDYGCAFEEQTIESQGKKMQAWRLPANPESVAKTGGRSLLYLHGNAGTIGANAAHACRLSNYGLNVLIFDYRGYGNSAGEWPREKTVYQDAEAAWQQMLKLEPDPKKIIIYGHSLGGAVAVDLAAKHPDAAGLIVESSFTSVREMGDRDPVFRYFPLSLLIHEKLDSKSKLASLKMPVLFIHGNADSIVPSYMSQRLYDAAHEPKMLVWIKGGDHDNNALIAGKTYSAAVWKFMDTLQPSPQFATTESKK
jgi:pimeloyl-ACP methyl ester carboxylesterase